MDNVPILYFDLDTTGNEIYDEVCSISLQFKGESYFTYIMPAKSFTFEAKNKLSLTIVNWQNVRVLRDTKARERLRTKSLYLTLKEVISWISERKKPDEDVLLAFFAENDKPAMFFVDSLERYNLLHKLSSEVGGFVNLYPIFKEKTEGSFTQFNLKCLAAVLLDQEENSIHITRCHQRVNYLKQIFNHLNAGLEKTEIMGSLNKNVVALSTVGADVKNEYEVLKMKKDLDPIFRKLFSSAKTRSKFVKYRNDLVSSGLTYSVMSEKHLANELPDYLSSKLDENEELITIIKEHFEGSQKNGESTTPEKNDDQ